MAAGGKGVVKAAVFAWPPQPSSDELVASIKTLACTVDALAKNVAAFLPGIAEVPKLAQ